MRMEWKTRGGRMREPSRSVGSLMSEQQNYNDKKNPQHGSTTLASLTGSNLEHCIHPPALFLPSSHCKAPIFYSKLLPHAVCLATYERSPRVLNSVLLFRKTNQPVSNMIANLRITPQSRPRDHDDEQNRRGKVKYS